ncbi:unnamed protein product, partial [Ixodes pacificus]
WWLRRRWPRRWWLRRRWLRRWRLRWRRLRWRRRHRQDHRHQDRRWRRLRRRWIRRWWPRRRWIWRLRRRWIRRWWRRRRRRPRRMVVISQRFADNHSQSEDTPDEQRPRVFTDNAYGMALGSATADTWAHIRKLGEPKTKQKRNASTSRVSI